VDVPETASDHPPTWRFDYPIYHPATLDAVHEWFEANHATTRGVWFASWRRPSGRTPVPYVDMVLEALCVGWIDSTVTVLDDDRALQLFTPRKPRSSWTRLNRERVARLEAEERMTEAGRRAVEVAQTNGYWTRFDAAEDLLEPDELAAALDATPAAREHWDGFPPSARKAMLWWLISASKPETRERRIARIVEDAATGKRAQG
jgi:uncharacterized protein YdeI (YjbR/CyaY-like superfamily)